MKRICFYAVALLSILAGITACSDSISSEITIYGTVVDADNNDVENVTIVIFFDDIEIARQLTQPITYTYLCDKPRISGQVNNICNNFILRIPLAVEFEAQTRTSSTHTLNSRLMQIGESKTFRTKDGHFLVVMALSSSAPRNTLILQPDGTIWTPAPGTLVPDMLSTFAPPPTPVVTQTPQQSAVQSQTAPPGDFFEEWVRYFLIGALLWALPASAFFFFLRQGRRRAASTSPKTKTSSQKATPKKEVSEGLFQDLFLSVGIEIVASLITGIIFKLLGIG